MDQPTPFFIPGAPKALLDQINSRRALIPAGMTMTAGAPEGDQQQGTQAPPPAQQAVVNNGQQPADDNSEDLSKLPKWAQGLITNLRKENGDTRMNAKREAAEEATKDLAQKVGKALGLVVDEKDPDKLLADLEKSRAAEADTLRELAVFRLASKNGADPDALLDSNNFMRSIASVDPKDDAKIADAIKDAVKNNTKLAAARAAGRSGTDLGGSGEGVDRTPASQAAPGQARIAAAYAQNTNQS